VFLIGNMDDLRIYNAATTDYTIATLASRRGIAYELAQRRRAYSIPAGGGGNRRRRLLIGS
jgi:hypothetical protein